MPCVTGLVARYTISGDDDGADDCDQDVSYGFRMTQVQLPDIPLMMMMTVMMMMICHTEPVSHRLFPDILL